MIFDLQPPSPSLSPNSKTRFYQEQLDKAHEIIDQLEVLLQEKEHQKKVHSTTYKNIEIPPLKLNTKLSVLNGERSRSYVTTPLQYSTPRDRRTRLSLGGQTSARFVEEMKNRHSELVLQFKEDNNQRECKNKELNDQIQELKSELIFCQEKQSITKKEKKQTEQKLEVLESQIQSIQMQLLLSKEKGNHLQQKIKEIKKVDDIQEAELELEEEINIKVQQQNQDSKLESEKKLQEQALISQISQKQQDKSSHKKLLGSLQKEIQLLENRKQELQNQTTVSQFEEKQIEAKEDYFIDQQHLIVQVPQNQNVVLPSESGDQVNTFIEEDIHSIKSSKNKEYRQRRSCESCQIF
ncbi:unnamed protein product (macronuclear) [Paramecium tetraurelia]|uniref:Uncharacterized protein n=1 Tax=Paramecium tetraurelia TaxID=5888 RepID=A0DAP9_PARTE|nr:uncharacterized protein GSPATT00015023001 [Paramecium tetraurelia]CAK80116.1 unnamed protein product [Paramecium tetraurelia]|eukprot:XP_001447513.1 hypothetical protein (macronuclear) [Paramecium tetraurelia strain d4-2]